MISRFYRMNINMLAVDIDGTLLNEHGDLTKRTREAIDRASDAGIRVILCTGRHHADALAYAAELNTNSPIVAGNGGIDVDQSHKVLFERMLPTHKVPQIEEALKNLDLQGIFYTRKGVYMQPGCPVENWYRERDHQLGGAFNLQLTPVVTPRIEESGDDVYKVAAVSFDYDRLRKLEHALAGFSLSLTQSASRNLEMMESGTTKALALSHLLQMYNIDHRNLAAVGDGRNDVDMIRLAGDGIAMANGAAELTEIADRIAPSNSEDGLAQAIDSLFVLETT